MEDLATIQDPAATKDVPAQSDALAARYREAIRTRFLPDRIGAEAGSAERLEERVRRIEEEAASVEMPSLWYFLESARHIRAGNLTEARTAFEAGLAGPAVHVGTLPPAVVVPVMPRAVPWDRIALAAYLGLLTIAELAVTFGNPLLVFPLHGGSAGWLRSTSRGSRAGRIRKREFAA